MAAAPAPEAPSGPGSAPGSASVPVPVRPLFGGCWSCRLLCGSGLLLAALWIYRGPRSSLKRGIAPSMADIAQITFAISVGAWGVVILVDPVGKQIRKEP